MERTCSIVATIFSLSVDWLAATWKISWIMSIIRSAAAEIMAAPERCSIIALRLLRRRGVDPLDHLLQALHAPRYRLAPLRLLARRRGDLLPHLRRLRRR